jgi:WD40 repeat protein
MLHSRSITASLRSRWLVVASIALAVVVAAGSIALAFAAGGSSGQPRPTGVITYAQGVGEVSVHPDGSAATGTSPNTGLNVQILDLTSGLASPDGTMNAQVETAPDGTSLSIRDPGGTHQIAQLAGPGDPRLIPGAKGEARSANGVPLVTAWSPDSKYLAFGSVSGFPFTLNVVERGSWQPQRFDVNQDYVGEAVWSPDGKYLAISTYAIDRANHTVYLWDPDKGTLTRLVDGCHVVWSPDGRYLVLRRDPISEPGISVVSVDGTRVQQLTTDTNSYPSSWTAEAAS